MNIARRYLTGALLALGTLTAGPVFAASADETTVMKNVQAHRDALFSADAKALDRLSAPQLSYSHSDAHVEDKATMIANATNGKSKWLTLNYENIVVRVVGTAAISRFDFTGQNQAGDKKSDIKIHVLMVWQKQGTQWKLLARASTKL